MVNWKDYEKYRPTHYYLGPRGMYSHPNLNNPGDISKRVTPCDDPKYFNGIMWKCKNGNHLSELNMLYIEERNRRVPYVPVEFAIQVCRCPATADSKVPRRDWSETLNKGVCTKCNKMDKVHLYKCFECNCVFLHNFSHPAWYIDEPTCWKCTTGRYTYTDVCVYYPKLIIDWNVRIGVVAPPESPKLMTDEEITDLLGF
jgi:hypothetical protein